VPPKLMFFGLFASEIAEPFLTSTQCIYAKQKNPYISGHGNTKKQTGKFAFQGYPCLICKDLCSFGTSNI